MNTFKKTVVGLVVVLTMLVSAKPADAQSLWRYLGVCLPGDPLCRVMVGNQQMVRHMQSGYMGYTRTDGFYGTHDPYGRPLPRLVKIAVGAGIGASIGGGVGDLFGHGREGTLIGAGIGALIGARHGSGNRNQPMVIDEGQQGQQGVRIASDGTPVAFGRPVAQTAPAPSLGIGSRPNGLVRRAINRTGMEVVVFHKGADPRTAEPVMVPIPRGGSFEVPLSGEGYDVYILVPTDTLGVQDVRKAAVVPNHDLNGWDIVAAS